MTYRIQASIVRKTLDGVWTTSRQIPTFEIEACSERNADRIARNILQADDGRVVCIVAVAV